jgi:uncharacterized membrane protein YdjX (TVP38/TMEM64 family)
MDTPTEGPDLKARVMTVLWPAFLVAGVLEMLVFAFVDPQGLHGWGVDSSVWSPTAVYTVAFLVFWAFIAAASAITLWLAGAAGLPQPRQN